MNSSDPEKPHQLLNRIIELKSLPEFLEELKSRNKLATVRADAESINSDKYPILEASDWDAVVEILSVAEILLFIQKISVAEAENWYIQCEENKNGKNLAAFILLSYPEYIAKHINIRADEKIITEDIKE